MDEFLTTEELQTKLLALNDERGIIGRLRTHLRTLMLSELQTGPGTQVSTPLTIRGRALGSLVVDWLQSQRCHYTLSVIASEIPGLSDLPGMVGESSPVRFQTSELQEILLSLDLKCPDIVREYENSQDSLLSCIVATANSWRERLNFKENIVTISDGDAAEQPAWCQHLRNILASAALKPGLLPKIYQSIVRLYREEIKHCIERERESYNRDILMRERQVQLQLKKQEESFKSRLSVVEVGYCKSKNEADEGVERRTEIMTKLLQEVKHQHQIVLEGLAIIEEREDELEREKEVWLKEVESERNRQMEVAKELELIRNAINQKRTKKSVSRGTQFQHDTAQNRDLKSCQQVKRESYLLRRISDSSITSSNSSSSVCSVDRAQDAAAGAWKRLKELQKETKVAKEEYRKFRKTAENDDSTSDNGSSTAQAQLISAISRYQNKMGGPSNKSQVTLPYCHEGIHSGAMDIVTDPTKSEINSPSSTGDQPKNSSPPAQALTRAKTKSKIPRPASCQDESSPKDDQQPTENEIVNEISAPANIANSELLNNRLNLTALNNLLKCEELAQNIATVEPLLKGLREAFVQSESCSSSSVSPGEKKLKKIEPILSSMRPQKPSPSIKPPDEGSHQPLTLPPLPIIADMIRTEVGGVTSPISLGGGDRESEKSLLEHLRGENAINSFEREQRKTMKGKRAKSRSSVSSLALSSESLSYESKLANAPKQVLKSPRSNSGLPSRPRVQHRVTTEETEPKLPHERSIRQMQSPKERSFRSPSLKRIERAVEGRKTMGFRQSNLNSSADDVSVGKTSDSSNFWS